MARQGALRQLSDLQLAPRPAQSRSLTRLEAPFRFRSVEPAVLQGRKYPRHRFHVDRRVAPTAPRAGDGRSAAGQRPNAPIGIDPPESVCVYNGKFSPRGLAARLSASARGLRAVRRSATDQGSLLAQLRQNVPCRLHSVCCVAVTRFAFRWPETLPKLDIGPKMVRIILPDAARRRFRGAGARRVR